MERWAFNPKAYENVMINETSIWSTWTSVPEEGGQDALWQPCPKLSYSLIYTIMLTYYTESKVCESCTLAYPVQDSATPTSNEFQPASTQVVRANHSRRISNIQEFIKRIQNRQSNPDGRPRVQERNLKTMNKLKNALTRLSKYKQWKQFQLDVSDSFHELVEKLHRSGVLLHDNRGTELRKKLVEDGGLDEGGFSTQESPKLCLRRKKRSTDDLPEIKTIVFGGRFKTPGFGEPFGDFDGAEDPAGSIDFRGFSDFAYDVGVPGFHVKYEDMPPGFEGPNFDVPVSKFDPTSFADKVEYEALSGFSDGWDTEPFAEDELQKHHHTNLEDSPAWADKPFTPEELDKISKQDDTEFSTWADPANPLYQADGAAEMEPREIPFEFYRC
ncbi:hypothetical protein CAPTEDRAFT_205021 [Capitella teleta]|uniref:Uncharacterized protein n=1 Tax=Capitella teleta TaxID=283909 RepID=R7T855_CAPTE|nr:hypothetical protein CAPTEDRAFT_205021 [Capitella teleta]|eukprot:ELT87144.1 hypothetical protein CAPTEDRAFT_205021 [Capitella teleta]